MTQVNYNEISKIYDDVREADIVLVDHFLQEIPAHQDFNVLDLGCGTGNYTDLFQRMTVERRYQIYGVDPSEGMIDRARKKNTQVVFQQGRADKIPFGDHFFDFIFMTDVIHHVPDIGAMFHELKRVLRSDGRLCIVTQSHRQIELRPIARFFPGTIVVDQQRYPDIAEIMDSARSAGLEYLKQEILFEGHDVALDDAFLDLVRKKGYSMLHLLTEQEYQDGLARLETSLQQGPTQAKAAGETLVWLKAA